MNIVDIWSREAVAGHLRLLAGSGQIRECAHLRIARGARGAYAPACEEGRARRTLAYNVAIDPTGRSGPSSYCWLRCPPDCPAFERAADFLRAAAPAEEGAQREEAAAEQELLSPAMLAELAATRDRDEPEPAIGREQWESAGLGAADPEPHLDVSAIAEPPAAPRAPGPLPEPGPPWQGEAPAESEPWREPAPRREPPRTWWATAGIALAAFLLGLAIGRSGLL